MKNLLIAFILGLFAISVAPIQSVANVADEQQKAVVITSQAGDASEVSPLLDLVTLAPGQMVECSGVGYNLFAQNDASASSVNDASKESGIDATIVSDLRDENGDLFKPVEVNNSGWPDILKSNWAELLIGLLAFVKILVRLTPTLKDDAVFGKIDNLINAVVPNFQSKNKNA